MIDSGTPRASTNSIRLLHFFPRSVGFGPTDSCASGAFTKAPSTLCQRQGMPSMSSYSASPACHKMRKNPALSHSRKRLWIALALPKRSLGSAFHWQPVRSTYTIASNTVRAPFGLRPPPGLRRNFFLRRRPGRSGTSGSTLRQNSSDTSQEASFAFGNGFLRCAHACVERENSITYYLRISTKYPDEAHGKVAEDCKANVADGTTQRRIEADLHGEHEPCNKCDQVGNQLHGHAPAVLNSLGAAQRAQQPSSRGRRRERKHDPPEEPLRPANRLRRQRLEKCRSDFPVQVRGARGYCPGTCVA